MKKLLFFFALLFMGAMTAFAQVPVNEQLTYQTVVRNAQNQLVFNQNDVTVKVYVCNVDGTVVTYSETHTGLSTNANGMLSLMIGSVAPDQGTWDGIDWSTAYIKTTISYGSVTITHDPAPVTAVPYALSAGNMSNITNIIGDAIHDSIPTNVSAFANDANYVSTTNLCTTIESCGNVPLKNGNNTFTGANDFTGGSVTVPNAITPDLATALSSTCTKDAVSLCDLLAVFDSLNRRFNSVYDSLARLANELEELRNSILPAASRTVKPCTVSGGAHQGSEYTGSGFEGANNGYETANGEGKITSVTDYDGNAYPVVQIGSQCWMAENLRCTHSPKTGSNLVGTAVTNSYGSKLALWYSNDESTYKAKRYGILYNWCAAMDTANPGSGNGGSGTYVEVVASGNNNSSFDFTPSGNHQGVCPKGWHVPTDDEWNAMELEVNGSDVSGSEGYRGSHAGKLSTGCDWVSDSTANVPGNYANAERNDSGFSAVPAGYFYSSFANAGNYAYFWSSSQYSSYGAWSRRLSYNNAGVYRNVSGKYIGYSVRCVRDYGPYTEDVTMTVANDGGGTVNLCGESTKDVTFTATITGDDANNFSFAWSDGTSTTSKDTVALGEGTHTITVTATSSSHTLTASTSVTVNSGGTAATLSLCEDWYQSKVTVRSTDCTSLSWVSDATGEEVSTSTTELQGSDAIPAGAYTVKGVNASGCSIEKQVVLGNYNPKPCTAASRGTHNPQVAGTYTPAHGSDGLETVDANENITSVKDIDNNEYKVVEIGSQCWMAVNLRTTKYADNTPITLGTNSNSSTTDGYYYDYSSGDPNIPLEQRGYLYNWPAAMKSTSNPEGTQGVCPTGWHVPTRADWQTMVTAADATTLTGAVYLSASCYWKDFNSATDGMTPNSYDNPDRNKSGFSAVPAGGFPGSSFDYSGNNAYFWSSSVTGSGSWYRGLANSLTSVREGNNTTYFGFSVRCVRDYGPYTEDVTMTVANDGGGTVNLCGESTKDVTFTATITGDDANNFSFAWSDGTSTTSKDTVALGEGTHTITVTATSSSHTLTASTSVTVSAGGTPISIGFCESEGIVSVKGNPQGSPNHLVWGDGDVFDGTVSESIEPHNYSTLGTGSHSVTITASNASGCSLSRTMTVTVLASGSTAADRTVKPCTVSGGAHQGSEYTGTGFEGANNGYETANGEGKITSVTDCDGNEYPVVQIGSQCWLAENLRCTHSPKTGSNLVVTAVKSFGSKMAAWYNDQSTYEAKRYGLLYNWCAAMDTANPGSSVTGGAGIYVEVADGTNNNSSFDFTPSGNHQGVCPKGWHVPTDAEWNAMELEVNGSDVSGSTGYRGSHAGKLSTGCDWSSSGTENAAGNYANAERNDSGFSAVPAGYFYSSFDFAGYRAYFWSSSRYSSSNAWLRILYCSLAGVSQESANKSYGFSVRCVRN